jgi:hypothetical protein
MVGGAPPDGRVLKNTTAPVAAPSAFLEALLLVI